MESPQPPEDIELKNIIDKLAQFVARNGPEFEQMTKSKQKGNPKFGFLYGGEHFGYYQYKVSSEQAVYKQQQQAANWDTPPPSFTPQQTVELDRIMQQQDALREQIKQSEQNLTAQHTVLMQQQQAAVEAAVAKCTQNDLQTEANNCGIVLTELNSILQPILDSCTKDSIGNGKSWFLQHADTKQKSNCVVQCLLYKVLQSGTFPQKLHIIYLVNDLLHHSVRKNACDLQEALEIAVVPMFCNASVCASDEQKLKLEKLLKLWESKANYLTSDTLDKLRNPLKSYQQYQSDQMAKYAQQVALLADQTKVTYETYQSQHQAFVCHAMQQIMDLQQQKQDIEQAKEAPPPIVQPNLTSQPNLIPLETIQATLQQTIQNLSQNTFPIPTIGCQTTTVNQTTVNVTQNPLKDDFLVNLNVPPPNVEGVFAQPPPGFVPQLPPPGAVFPDFSKPPPGFAQAQQPPPEVYLEELVPTAPYYDLPAGLMVPLVKLEDSDYKPLDPKDIRLPPPAPPNERLLAAVESFYSLPTHERPRDSEGWEKLGLYEYYKAKNHARREKEEAIKSGLREKSRSPSPIILRQEKQVAPLKRRYSSKSPSPPVAAAQRPTAHRRKRSRSRSRSRSPRRSRRSRRSRRHSRSRSRSPLAVKRSLSPSTPGFGSTPYTRSDAQELDASNKGHEMLRKMGWGGKGLGVKEQGIDAPISGGDVRDRHDQFKGVGCNLNDPFENFRKNKGAAFITRMKARAEEREKESCD